MRSETFEWTGPVVGPRVDFGVSGVAYLSGIRDGVFPAPPIGPLISAEIVEVDPRRVHLICSASDSQFGLRGELDPGAAQLVVNAAINCVARTLVGSRQGWATLESRSTYFRHPSSRCGSLTATAEVVESSSGGAVVVGELADEHGHVVTKVTTTLSVFDLVLQD